MIPSRDGVNQLSDVRKKSIRSYQDLFHVEPSSQEFNQAIHEACGSSDRSSALLFASQVETSLNKLIGLHLANITDDVEKDLYRQGGVLSTFSNKSVFALITGKIDARTKNELDLIRKVRNAFAHSVLPLDFEEKAISQICLRLDLAAMEAELQRSKEETWEDHWTDSKKHFCGVCIGYILRFSRLYADGIEARVDELQKQFDELKDVEPILNQIRNIISS